MDFEDEDLQEAMRRAREGFDMAMDMELPKVGVERVTQFPEVDLTEPPQPQVAEPVAQAPVTTRKPLVPPPAQQSAPAPKEAPRVPPGPFGDEELNAAIDADARTRQAMALERAGRNLVGALSKQTPQALLTQAPSAERLLLERRKQAKAAEVAAQNAAARQLSAEAFNRQSETQADVAPKRLEAGAVAEARKTSAMESDIELRKRSQDLQERGLALKEAAAAAKAQRVAGGGVSEKDVQELAKRIGGDPAALEADLAALDPYVRGTGDVPGIGKLDAMVPDIMASDEALKVRNSATRLVDALLKLQSGTGVSNQERQAKYKQYGLGATDERVFREGMQNLRRELMTRLQQAQSGFKPGVVKEYQRRGGITAATASVPTQVAQQPDQPSTPQQPQGDTVSVQRIGPDGRPFGKPIPVSRAAAQALIQAGKAALP